jgi:hypothetical protein
MVEIKSIIRWDKLFLFLVVFYAIDISITFNYATESKYDPWLSIQRFEMTEELFSPGPLGYGIAVGTQRPGKHVEVHFYSLSQEGFDLNATVDFKLVRIDDGLVSVISEKSRDIERVPPYGIRWTVQLPEEAPARYRFGVVLRDEDNETIGLLISTLKVPVQELNATMTLNKARFRVGEKPVLIIRNYGSTVVNFGVPYRIERAVNNEWVEVSWDRVWILPLCILEPGDTYRQKADLPRLQPGEYRFSNTVSAEGTYLSETLTAEFMYVRDMQTVSFGLVVVTVVIVIVIGIKQLRNDKQRDEVQTEG